jgi:hypothetical protein
MAGVAIFLIQKNHSILLGQTIPRTQMEKILSQLQSDRVIKDVKDVKALMMGSDSMRFKVDYAYSVSFIL